MKMNFIFFGSLLILVVLLAITLKKYPNNRSHTSLNHNDKKLRTRKYKVVSSFPQFGEKVQNIIPNLRTYGRKWRLISSAFNEENRSLVLRVEVPVFFFIDDMEIQIRSLEESKEVLIDATSRSRKGKSDLGENRRHIIDFFTELEKAYAIEPVN